MVRILIVTFVFALSACASSKAAEKPADPPAAGGGAPATAEVAADGEEPCMGKSGKALVDCKKSQKDVKTKFLFKSSGGDGAAGGAAGGSDDDDDDDE